MSAILGLPGQWSGPDPGHDAPPSPVRHAVARLVPAWTQRDLASSPSLPAGNRWNSLGLRAVPASVRKCRDRPRGGPFHCAGALSDPLLPVAQGLQPDPGFVRAPAGGLARGDGGELAASPAA